MRAKTIAISLSLCAVLAACGKSSDESKVTYDLSAESNQKFLADYAAKPGVVKTEDGLEYRVIKSGNGKKPDAVDDIVSVRYVGKLIDGTVFDRTREGGISRFPLGNLIPGWVEALSKMKEGDEWELVIPANLAYGPEGAGNGAIPGGQTLVFNMTLLSIEPAE
jgi:FKBP-type peptidyl-prolyl cis-trans isomerase